MSKKDKRFLDLAIKLAEESTAKQRHGCVVVQNGNIVSLGVNRDINNPLTLSAEHSKASSIHAEVRALNKVSNPKGAVVYVARLTPGGAIGLSAPCPECSFVIHSLGVKRVVHT